jgi:hypothetical protein
MYSILRNQYVHITPDSVVQYTPKYSFGPTFQITLASLVDFGLQEA